MLGEVMKWKQIEQKSSDFFDWDLVDAARSNFYAFPF